jgi:hypothetical protein
LLSLGECSFVSFRQYRAAPIECRLCKTALNFGGFIMFRVVKSVSTAVYLLTLSLIVWLDATHAHAAIIPLTASLDCAKANAGAGTCGEGGTGTGTATTSLDTATNSFTWSITWSGLSGDPTLMHFHGPALTNQNAGVQVSTGVAGPPVVGNAILDAGQVTDLLAGLWYLNLHTTTFAGGEIRGQVTRVPEPSTGVLLVSGILGLLSYTRRRQQT